MVLSALRLNCVLTTSPFRFVFPVLSSSSSAGRQIMGWAINLFRFRDFEKGLHHFTRSAVNHSSFSCLTQSSLVCSATEIHYHLTVQLLSFFCRFSRNILLILTSKDQLVHDIYSGAVTMFLFFGSLKCLCLMHETLFILLITK